MLNNICNYFNTNIMAEKKYILQTRSSFKKISNRGFLSVLMRKMFLLVWCVRYIL